MIENEMSFGTIVLGKFNPGLTDVQYNIIKGSMDLICNIFELTEKKEEHIALEYDISRKDLRRRNGILEHKFLIKKFTKGNVRFKISEERIADQKIPFKATNFRKYDRVSYIGEQWRFDLSVDDKAGKSLEIEYQQKELNAEVSELFEKIIFRAADARHTLIVYALHKRIGAAQPDKNSFDKFRGLFNMPKSFDTRNIGKMSYAIAPKLDGSPVILAYICGATYEINDATVTIFDQKDIFNLQNRVILCEKIDNKFIIFDMINNNSIEHRYKEIQQIAANSKLQYAPYSFAYNFDNIASSPFKNDGIIFISLDGGYYNCNIMKWKPKADNNIDFIYRDSHLYVYSNGDYKLFSGIKINGKLLSNTDTLNVPIKIPNESIVECNYQNDHFEFIRVRTDKKTPNSFYVAVKTLTPVINYQKLRAMFNTFDKLILTIKRNTLERHLFEKTTILDLGIGNDDQMYSDYNVKVTGLDIAPHAINGTGETEFIAQDFNNFFDLKRKFDLIVLNFSIQYFPKYDVIFDNIARHIAYPGKVIINVMNGKRAKYTIDKKLTNRISLDSSGNIHNGNHTEVFVETKTLIDYAKAYKLRKISYIDYFTFARIKFAARLYSQLSANDKAYFDTFCQIVFQTI